MPDRMPVSSWMFDAVPQIKQSAWRLSAGGRDWTYDELFAYDDRLTATLDCTGGFFSTQELGWHPTRSTDRKGGRHERSGPVGHGDMTDASPSNARVPSY